VAEIVAVEGDALTLAGADVVDGTPVLDVKPYLPFADGVPGATAPPWVRCLLEVNFDFVCHTIPYVMPKVGLIV